MERKEKDLKTVERRGPVPSLAEGDDAIRRARIFLSMLRVAHIDDTVLLSRVLTGCTSRKSDEGSSGGQKQS